MLLLNQGIQAGVGGARSYFFQHLLNLHIMDFAVRLLCVSGSPIISGDKEDGNVTDAGGCPPSMLTQRE